LGVSCCGAQSGWRETYVEQDDDHAKDDDPDRHVDVGQPVLQDDARRRQVVGQHDDVLKEIVPPCREAHGRVDKARGVAREALLVRQPGAHLAERDHDHVDDEAHEGVPD